MPNLYVYYFGNGQADGSKEDKALLGSKGANLAEMTRIGIPVPPGFTITTDVCRTYLKDETYPKGVDKQVASNLRRLEVDTGKKFGGAENPLLVSVRSGSAISMPGMMETILNLGLNDTTVEALSRASNNPRFAYDSYRRFIQMYSDVVLHVNSAKFEELLAARKQTRGVESDTDLNEEDLRYLVVQYKKLVLDETGEAFPEDPVTQLWGAIKAVFESWNIERAVAYRKVNKIPDELGTAVSVCSMAYGNMGDDSGTGVAFTRNPSTGENTFFGEFLINAQGEDVVAGIRTPISIDQMAHMLPEPYKQLLEVQRTLEQHYREMQDLEFTVERGRLYLLQTRTGKRTAAAAVRIAVDMVDERLISRDEAVLRVDPMQLDQLLHPMLDPKAKTTLLVTGLPASPGAASGKVVFEPSDAVVKAAEGEDVILVRAETSPDDFQGMVAARAIVTSRGGMTSHAAVVARGMGKCCVVGAHNLRIDTTRRCIQSGDVTVNEGEWVTVDGTTGRVLVGKVGTVEPELSEHFRRLMKWADEVRRLKVRANADTPADARNARDFGAEGIGLCRTEHMFFEGERIQAVREMILAENSKARRVALAKILPMQREDFKGIFRIMDGLPVTIRLLDPPLHEFLPHSEEDLIQFARSSGLEEQHVHRLIERHREANPMLGHRGVRLGLSYPEITEMQARAIFEAAAESMKEGFDVRPEVMVPLVSTVQELTHQKKLISAVATEVMGETGVSIPYTVGTMIEIPRAALMANEIASVADFFSFGTNDLTQTTFGISRDDAASFLPRYIEEGIFPADPFAVLDREGVGQLVQMATWEGRQRRSTLKVGVCGEHGGEPQSVEFFHEVGLDYVSCSPFRVPVARLSAAHAALKNRPAKRGTSGPAKAVARAVMGAIGIGMLASACATKAPPVAAAPPRPPVPVVVDTAVPPQVRATRELVLLGTTDVHNRLWPYDYYTRKETGYGLARLKPMIDSVRAANTGRTYLFDSGDILQGNPLGFVFARMYPQNPSPMIRAMNLLKYDASTIGNHEFNYGLPNLNKAVGEAKFPFVTANIFKHGTNEYAYKPYILLPHVVENGDTILIGITGNTPPGVAIWDKNNVENILDFRDVVASLRPVVYEMKQKGADVIVVLSHGGLSGSSYDTITTGVPVENASARLAREVAGIDVIFMGHTHREVRDSTINGVLLTQALNWAQSLADVTLKLERRAANDWTVIDKRAVILKPSPARSDSAFMDSLRWQHEKAVGYVKSVAGISTARMESRTARVEDTPIIDFVSEVMRKAAGTDLSAASAFSLNAAIPKGPVTIGDIAGLYNYENTLKAIRITGAQLKAYLEKSAEFYTGWPVPEGKTLVNRSIPGYNFDMITGADYTMDISKPVGQRITSLTFKGKPVTDDQTFTMAINNYRQPGGGGFTMIGNAPVIYDRQQGIRELLIDEFRKRGTLNPADYFTRNWKLVPAEARAQALREGGREDGPATASVPAKKLRVITTNDVHGRLLPEVYPWSNGRQVGGMATLAAYFQMEKDGFDGPSIILDGGDVMQGTPVSNLTKGRSTVATFNAANVSVAAIGNHDFDWSVKVLRDRIAQAKYPWLSANVFIAGTDKQPPWAKPTTMLTVGDVKVGVIGLSTQFTPATTKAINTVGLEFRSGSAALDRWVPELRKAGADFVIAVAHSGVGCDADYKKCEGEALDWIRNASNKPDLFVAGHTHRLAKYSQSGVPVVESASYTTRYGVVDMTKDSAGTSTWIHDFPTPYVDLVTPDKRIEKIVADAQREIGPQVNRVITTFVDTIRRAATTGEGPLGNLIADAFRVSTGAQLSFVNNGSIRIGEIPAGPVTWSTLFSLQPFENRLITLTMTGALIREVMELALGGNAPGMHISGMTVTYDPSAPKGQRVRHMRLPSGDEIVDSGNYTAAVTDFLATGTGDGYRPFGRSAKQVDAGLTDIEALLKYLQSQPQPVKIDRAERRFLVMPTN